eukprot:TRINITY_DN16176_c1_g1_i1.p1 TRINITY_DN16176_c1_g1~~TRINITY_DN16176_c1_g1_i1.p1  ORF type:complete len:131 (-),score=28.81 TRINITY_DN16176_c1_g1_i1:454-846(-)
MIPQVRTEMRQEILRCLASIQVQEDVYGYKLVYDRNESQTDEILKSIRDTEQYLMILQGSIRNKKLDHHMQLSECFNIIKCIPAELREDIFQYNQRAILRNFLQFLYKVGVLWDLVNAIAAFWMEITSRV